jgi:hypothetical protein
MNAIFLPPILFQQVISSSKCKILHIVTPDLFLGEEIVVIQSVSHSNFRNSIQLIRYVSAIYESEYIMNDEIIATIELSSLPIPLLSKH